MRDNELYYDMKTPNLELEGIEEVTKKVYKDKTVYELYPIGKIKKDDMPNYLVEQIENKTSDSDFMVEKKYPPKIDAWNNILDKLDASDGDKVKATVDELVDAIEDAGFTQYPLDKLASLFNEWDGIKFKIRDKHLGMPAQGHYGNGIEMYGNEYRSFTLEIWTDEIEVGGE